ncbi:MAG: hypothetical protein K8F30_01970, partial [Taibaiella sp.]|nr:hypothetical protein [Taibaiella sp.]
MYRQPILYIVLLFLSIMPFASKANNAAAGEITYTWLSDSTYRVLFKLYNDCSGSSAPDSIPLCVYNGCANNGFTTMMHKLNGNIRNNTLGNGSEVPIGCWSQKPTICTSPSSTLPGLREWWYVDTVMLPARCTNWRFRVALSARNSAKNISSGNMLVETVFNNLLSLQNSSPDFFERPTIFVCLNQPFMHDMNAIDPDGDSLDFSLSNVKTVSNLNCGTAPAGTGIVAVNPPINLINNPIQTNNSFAMNDTTGFISLTSTDSGRHTFTVRVEEYRNGALIGSVLRDMQVYTFKCGSVIPLIDTSTARRFYIDSIIGGAQRDTFSLDAIGCMGTTLDYYFPFPAFDTSSRLVLSDNVASALPGASVTYT